MKHSTLSPMKQNRPVEWRGDRKDPDDRPGCGVDDQARDQIRLVVTEVEPEEKLSLPRGAPRWEKCLRPESGP